MGFVVISTGELHIALINDISFCVCVSSTLHVVGCSMRLHVSYEMVSVIFAAILNKVH
jgi:hypothetical protein